MQKYAAFTFGLLCFATACGGTSGVGNTGGGGTNSGGAGGGGLTGAGGNLQRPPFVRGELRARHREVRHREHPVRHQAPRQPDTDPRRQDPQRARRRARTTSSSTGRTTRSSRRRRSTASRSPTRSNPTKGSPLMITQKHGRRCSTLPDGRRLHARAEPDDPPRDALHQPDATTLAGQRDVDVRPTIADAEFQNEADFLFIGNPDINIPPNADVHARADVHRAAARADADVEVLRRSPATSTSGGRT